MKQLLVFIFIIIFLSFVPFVRGVEAASLRFDKTTYTAAPNSTFQIQVIVDAGSNQITSVDAYVVYDQTKLEVQTVDKGTFFPTVTNTITAGKVYIAGLVDDPATSKTGSGTLATITFKAITGQPTVTFFCDLTVYNTSKIIKNDFNSTNIITCNQNSSLQVSISSGGTTSITPTTAAGTTAAPTPSTLPSSGIIDNIIKYSAPGMLLLLIGGAIRLIL